LYRACEGGKAQACQMVASGIAARVALTGRSCQRFLLRTGTDLRIANTVAEKSDEDR
jgi:hypothetical protein